METSNRVVCGMVLGEASESDEDSDVPNNSTVADISLVPRNMANEMIVATFVATSARNANDITGVEDSLNNKRNINYTAKKNISQGMMDIALLTANASQLRYVMRSPYWEFYHKLNITLICISIALQIIAGILLVCVSRKDYKRKDVREGTRIMNDFVVYLIFAITLVNIFIATFGIDDERTTFLRWKQTATDIPSEPYSPTGV